MTGFDLPSNLNPNPERIGRIHVDAAAGGSFLSLDVVRAKTLIDKIASNQSWIGETQPARPRGVHQIDTVDMLAAKLELLMKKLESPHHEVNQVS
jgi:hypothetical protein